MFIWARVRLSPVFPAGLARRALLSGSRPMRAVLSGSRSLRA
jgi:hypothetical protein